jgi:biofilm PGA synthesis lipoprotein PgaB
MMLKTHTRLILAGLLLLAILALTACAKDIPVYTPPDQRPLAPAEQPWVQGQFLALAYHDVEDEDPDQGFLSVRTDRLVEQLAWLRARAASRCPSAPCCCPLTTATAASTPACFPS